MAAGRRPYGRRDGGATPCSRRTAFAKGEPLLPPQEASERPELPAVPDVLERLLEDVAHVERQAGVEPAAGVDEGVARDERAWPGRLAPEVGVPVELHHLGHR